MPTNGVLSAVMTVLVACNTPAAQTDSFQYKGHVPLQGNPVAVVSVDFNQDGNRDLAVVHYDSENVSVLIGDGDGNFQRSGRYAVEGKPDRSPQETGTETANPTWQ